MVVDSSSGYHSSTFFSFGLELVVRFISLSILGFLAELDHGILVLFALD